MGLLRETIKLALSRRMLEREINAQNRRLIVNKGAVYDIIENNYESPNHVIRGEILKRKLDSVLQHNSDDREG